jgi:hypothetical protein
MTNLKTRFYMLDVTGLAETMINAHNPRKNIALNERGLCLRILRGAGENVASVAVGGTSAHASCLKIKKTFSKLATD